MKHDPLISIVVPVYNRESTLERCLDSMAAQTGIGQCHIIMVDNNSSDMSVEVIRKWSSRHPSIALELVTEPRRGAAIARNTGLDRVTTPYVMFFDSDDEMMQGHIARIINGINCNPEADLFGWDVLCELPDGRSYKAPFLCRRPMRDHLIHSSVSTQRIAVRTDFIRAVGGWDATLTGWDDFELGVRLVARHPVIVRIPDADGRPLVRTYYSDNSITGSTFSTAPRKWEDALDRIEETLAKADPAELATVAYRRAALAGLYAREKATDQARRLLAIAVAPGFGRIKSKIVYMTARHAGRGTRLMARLLLR